VLLPKPKRHSLNHLTEIRTNVYYFRLRFSNVDFRPTCGAAAAVWNGSEWLCWTCVHKLAETEAQVGEAERLYPDLLEPIYHAAAEYTSEMAAKDRADLFG
jgi:hypothetical protein